MARRPGGRAYRKTARAVWVFNVSLRDGRGFRWKDEAGGGLIWWESPAYLFLWPSWEAKKPALSFRLYFARHSWRVFLFLVTGPVLVG